jgi:hypothetical protein
LGLPRELEFKFAPSGRHDSESLARIDDSKVRGAALTINERRAKDGLSLLDAPEADQLLFVSGSSLLTLSEDGWQAVEAGSGNEAMALDEAVDGAEQPEESEAAAEQPAETASLENADKAVTEMKAFLRWLRKSPNRNFKFEYVPQTYAAVINKSLEIKDLDFARWYAERFLG